MGGRLLEGLPPSIEELGQEEAARGGPLVVENERVSLPLVATPSFLAFLLLSLVATSKAS